MDKVFVDSTLGHFINSAKIKVKEVGKDEHFHIPLSISGKNRSACVDTLIDSGASASFINEKFVKQNNVIVYPLAKPIAVYNIDGTPNKGGELRYATVLDLNIGGYKIRQAFIVTNIGQETLILGIDWLRKYNPMINWANGTLELDRDRIITEEELDAYCDAPRKRPEVRIYSTSIPERYKEFEEVFSKEASERFPEAKIWDHPIEMKEGFLPSRSKVYPLSPGQQKNLDEFLEEHLKKGYIRESKSPQSSPFFFIDKKDGSLRPVQDYRRLNEFTIKNSYPLPLIQEITESMRNSGVFTKMDVRWGYNNVRIKDGDQWKAAFVTNHGLYEPMVMFFGLTNSPATFQKMMNEIFYDLIIKGHVKVYLDDILIHTTKKDVQLHRELTKEVLTRLRDHDLFLKPEKCVFEADKVEYLGVIISEGKTEMDPAKIKSITEWPVPKNVSDVRSFKGMANFYRRFIKDFSRICKPLDRLTGDVPWKWEAEEQEAFDTLKKCFTSTPVLAAWQPARQNQIEVDASNFAIGAILSQQQDDGKWHPVSYFSKSMDEAERNYDIYDKEMLAIIKSLENWKHFLQGSEHQIDILSDHKNLEYWTTARNLTRRQA